MAWVTTPGSAQALYAVGEAYRRCGQQGGQIVVVRGPSESGRTAVLQQIYEWIATQQPEPPYWPASLTTTGTPIERRDIISPPELEIPAGAVLPWLWWGLSGREDCAVWRAREQLRWHGEPVQTAATAAGEAIRKRVGVAIDAAVLLAGLMPASGAVMESIKSAVGATDNLSLGTTLPSRVREACTPTQTRFDAALRANAGRRFTATPQHLSDVQNDGQLVATVAEVIPVIVAVDDADGLDEISVAVLETLVRSSGFDRRTLLVLTINTDHHPTHPDQMLTRDENLDADHNPELHWMLSNLASQHRVTTIDLPPFTPTELTHLVRALLPEFPTETTSPSAGQPPLDVAALGAVITHVAGRPGRMASLLGDRAVRIAISTGGELPDLHAMTARSSRDQPSTPSPRRFRSHWRASPSLDAKSLLPGFPKTSPRQEGTGGHDPQMTEVADGDLLVRVRSSATREMMTAPRSSRSPHSASTKPPRRR